MTADRWWVQLAARWLARIDGVKGHVQMFSLAVTAFSTFSIMLQGFGLGQYIPYLAIVSVLIGLVYIYLYTEGGVWNQVRRDTADLSGNYAPPTMLMDDVCIAIGQFAAVHGREPTTEELEMLERSVRRQWSRYRDGIDVDELAQPPAPRPSTTRGDRPTTHGGTD